jgi:methionyl-tRNA synthetase
MNPEWLRYYIAAKLNGRVEDVDFNPDDFVARVNADLIGKYVNIASRAVKFVPGGKLAASELSALDAAGWSRPCKACTRRASTARRCAR